MAPIPSPSEITATTMTPGLRRMVRRAYLMSLNNVSMKSTYLDVHYEELKRCTGMNSHTARVKPRIMTSFGTDLFRFHHSRRSSETARLSNFQQAG